MELVLRRISYGKYDDFIEKNISTFPIASKDYFCKNFEYVTEDVIVDGKALMFELDIDEFIKIYDSIVETNDQNPMEVIDIQYAELLYKTLSQNTTIPKYVLYEKEVWAYLNCFVFFDIVKKRFFPSDESLKDEGRITRVVFCDDSNIDRTGLRWLWALADATYDEQYDFSLTLTARQFIDPVKAIYERTFGTNRIVFKAYIRAIQLLDSDTRIKSGKFRSILPTHIRNLATMKIYESYDSVDTLATIFAEDIKRFLDDNNE